MLDSFQEAHAQARGCAAHLRLAIHRQTWRGQIGNWAGAGTGSSIDFQDHRPYLPGDDPRHIDWQAYARSGQTILKLYREEVSPSVDLLFDASESMRFPDEKALQVLSLLLFCVESAQSLGVSLRVHGLTPEKAELWELPQLLSGRISWPEQEAREEGSRIPQLEGLPLRHGSLRILISDLLFPAAEQSLLRKLGEGQGRVMFLVPWHPDEADPDWKGNMELRDRERGVWRRQRVDEGILRRYKEAYAAHENSWRDAARRYGAAFARVRAGQPLADALREEALRLGVLEAWA